jgi:F-type H+-transporting ATPase subunit delta
MFTPERWAEAFVNVMSREPDAVEAGLALLKAISPAVRSIPAIVTGTDAAARLEPMIRAALKAGAPDSAGTPGRTEEMALRFALLLVKRGSFYHIDLLIGKIEEELDALRGFLRAGLESAFAEGEGFKKDLEERIARKTGAEGVRLDVKIIPELLGGYRLRIGGKLIDASLRAQLQKMETDLAAAYIPGKSGGF